MSAIEERVEQLLKAGLDFYGINCRDEAARCWREALTLDPLDRRAREYLEALREEHGPALFEPVATPSGGSQRFERREHMLSGLREVVEELEGNRRPSDAPAFDKASFIALLRDKKLEEALSVLYQIRDVAPDNDSVSRGIQLVKEKLISQCLEHIGNLDGIPRKTAAAAQLLAVTLPTQDENAVLRLVDGIASAGDVLESCRAGRFQAAKAFCRLLTRGVLEMQAPPPSAPRPAKSAPPLPPQPGTLAPAPAPRTAPSPPPQPPPVTSPSGVFLDPQPVSPTGSRVADTFDTCFRQATEAYLRRNYSEALDLFLRCLGQRPDDRRVRHNIDRLQQRKNSP